MPISFHPKLGTLLICDFEPGFVPPEMVKRRPVIVVSPPISVRVRLCTVVPLSSTAPDLVMPYHCKLVIDPPLPDPWNERESWVKGDMVFSASFQRLNLIRAGKDWFGKRKYRENRLSAQQMMAVRTCILCSLGLAHLTKHL
jgi:mRNA interferase MazF